MANYWAIAIGINQYQSLQPLSYAQRDAQVLRDFLVNTADFPPDNTWLFTDGVGSHSAAIYPNGNPIQMVITQICQRQLQPDDMLWCFFSGYGARFQGNDYLLPIDVDPEQIPATAISLDFLFRTLRTAPTSKILLILDMNRSQNPLAGEGIGQQTAQLAQDYAIPTLLSCLPNQLSHETLTLRQGLFTATLIEALQHGSVTLEQLVQRVQEQLPRQSELHWRPRQDLLAIIPPERKYQLIVPPRSAARLGTVAMAAPRGSSSHLAAPSDPAAAPTDNPASKAASGALPVSLPAALTRLEAWSGIAAWFKADPSDRSSERSPLRSRLNLLLPGSEWLTAETDSSLALSSPPLNVSAEGSSPSLAEPKLALATDDRLWKRWLWQGGLIAGMLLLGVLLRNSQLLVSSSPQAESGTTPTSPEPVATPAAASPEPLVPIDPELGMQSARAAFQAQQYEEAQRLLLQIPLSYRHEANYTALLEQVNRELINKAKTVLIRSRQATAENQASDFVDAIKIARLIKPDQPLYQEAQQNIDRWSRIIMDMAQGRAERANESSTPVAANNYSAAIGTARLVPTDRPKVYEQAQQAIALWSQMILDLANARAAAGDLDLAIQVAELVPPNTPSHAAAQEAIAGWRNQPIPEASSQSAMPLSAQAAAESVATDSTAASAESLPTASAETEVETEMEASGVDLDEPNDATWSETLEGSPDVFTDQSAEAVAPEESLDD
ncbi:MAG: caspase family protein [Synechococcales cyanobacterium C42_A2020_086]|nr:caspase family protein [Synechococcales cyanobacterium C42_A2020_086]